MNYTKQRSLYGGVVGSMMVHTTDGLGSSNDPNSAQFKEIIPAGYLRCDGSVLNASDFPALAAVLGVGGESRFAKDNVDVRPANLETGDAGQFILPDMGSKVIVGGRGSGVYNNYRIDRGIEEARPTNRVGPQIEVVSNFGNRIETFYSGNMDVSAQSSLPMIGNPRYNLDRQTTETELTIENFQGHLHNANQSYTNFSANHEVAFEGGKFPDLPATSGHGIYSDFSEEWEATSIHRHNIARPITYSHDFTYSFPDTPVDMSGVSAYVDVKTSSEEKLDQLMTPFILVEYIIKF